ncbi:MAG: retention module-containing protein, partial [Chlorobiaceae bacterium]|nr:retention module-containing protein [Chlorobiaceae bacterium]
MSNNHYTPLATVSEISGKVWVRSQDGTLHLLHKGDTVYEGDVIITDDGSQVKLKAMNGATLDVMQGKELALNIELFQDSGTAGEQDSSSPAPPAPKSQSGKNPSREDVQQTEDDSSGIHGYMRVGRISETIGNAPYTFLSYTGGYTSTLEGRTTGSDSFLEGRATTDERIQMSISPLNFSTAEFIPAPTYVPGTTTYYVPAVNEPPVIGVNITNVSEEGLDGGNKDDNPVSPDDADTTDESTVPGSLSITDPDSSSFTATFIAPATSFTSKGDLITWNNPGVGEDLIGTANGREIILIRITGITSTAVNYDVILKDQVDHPDATIEDTLQFDVNVSVSDGSNSAVGTITVVVEDDSPELSSDGQTPPAAVTGQVWEDALTTAGGADLSQGNPDG